jgi:thiol:disulfide interchange protein DsbC
MHRISLGNKVVYTVFMLMLLFVAPSVLLAMDCKTSDCASCHTLTNDEAMGLLKETGGTVRSIKMAPVKGMFELLMEKDGKQGLVYIDFSKTYLLQGFIVDFAKLTTVAAHSEELPKPKNPDTVDLKEIPAKNAIVLGNQKGSKRLYLFTDPDCPYCREMHKEIKRLVKMMPDLTVYVMLYPLPSHPEAYDKSRALITLKKQDLLDKAFTGGLLPGVGSKDGVNQLNDIMNYARRNGIKAAPTVVLSDGRVMTGARTAEELAVLLNGNKQ